MTPDEVGCSFQWRGLTFRSGLGNCFSTKGRINNLIGSDATVWFEKSMWHASIIPHESCRERRAQSASVGSTPAAALDAEVAFWASIYRSLPGAT